MSEYAVFDYSEMVLDIDKRLHRLHRMCLNNKFAGYQEEVANMKDAIYCLEQWMQKEANKAIV